MLLIDASNSMKGSIKSAMQAARAFAARNPGQPLSVVFFNSKPTVALPLTTNPKAVNAVLGKRRSSARGRGSTTRSWRPSRRCAARRSARRASRPAPTATTSAAPRRLDAAIAQLQREKIRVFTVGIAVARFQGRGSPAARGEHRWHVCLRHLGRGVDRGLRPAWLRARQRVPAPLPTPRPGRTRTSTSRSPSRAQSRCRSRTRALRRDVRPVQAGLARQFLPVVVPRSRSSSSSSSG